MSKSQLNNVIWRIVGMSRKTPGFHTIELEGNRDVSKKDEILLNSFGVKVTEDFPHAGNGYTVTGQVTELSWSDESLREDKVVIHFT